MKIKDLQKIIDDILSKDGITLDTELEFTFGKAINQRFMNVLGYGFAHATRRGETEVQPVMYIEISPDSFLTTDAGESLAEVKAGGNA